MLYKKGDIVTIRKDITHRQCYYMLKGNKRTGIHDIAIGIMLKHAGQKATIIDYSHNKYLIEFFNNTMSFEYWTDEMFEETFISDSTLLVDIIIKNMVFA
ncbi:MAG: hypothetical protein PHY47_12835 [Lachnospiraceae bacterium]|nr:hypothetical protein [Lachnospiraceae bacterium]